MTISVSIQKENKDGSADALIRFEKEDLETLVQWGFRFEPRSRSHI